jgi:outer membrane protein TolC
MIVVLVTATLLWGPTAGIGAAPESDGQTPVSLSALIEEARANNPEVLSARQRWIVAQEEIPQAMSLDDPQLTFTQWGIPSHLNVGRADETWVGVGQSFPYPGKLALKGEIAGKTAEVVEQNYRAKVREVTARVKAAWFQRFLIQKSIDLHVEHQVLLEAFIEVAHRRYAVGQASQQESLKAQVELSKLHNSLLVMRQEQTANLAEINTLLNRPLETELGPVEPLEYRPFPWTVEVLAERALKQRPELAAATLMIEKSRQARLLADKNHLPDFMVEAVYWDVHGDPNQWQANFKMNLPGVFRDKYDARARQAAAEEATARAEQAALRNRTLFEVKDFFVRIKTSEQIIEVYRTGLLPQAEQVVESNRIGYRAGRSDFLSVIESARDLLDLQREYVGTLVQFWQGVAELERSVGGELKF